ncbi:MAG: DUF3496 domain-containing protein [Paludibacteraceae bacterium]|nr:DUF3496 domain-containing protein [Paludibacteraceae bacterium]
MFGRENLKEEWADCLVYETLVYDAVDADEVMDKMEVRIKELETELAKEKAYSHSLRKELSNYNELYKH